MRDIDWEKIQIFYNDNHTWNDIVNEFKINSYTINKAVKAGKLEVRNKKEAGKLANIKFPLKHSEETKKKLSEIRKKYLMENPNKVPYLLNHYSKGESYPEKYFDDIFKDKFEYDRYLPISLYHIDFAVTNKKIAIEIDGNQHYLDNKIIESDKRKNTYLLKNGWDIIRIKWSDYQKMNFSNKENYISNLIDYIKNLIDIKPEIIIKEKEYFCVNCGISKVYIEGNKCVKCSHITQRKVKNRPSKNELIEMVANSSLEAVGRKYGVTGNCIKKWLK